MIGNLLLRSPSNRNYISHMTFYKKYDIEEDKVDKKQESNENYIRQ